MFLTRALVVAVTALPWITAVISLPIHGQGQHGLPDNNSSEFEEWYPPSPEPEPLLPPDLQPLSGRLPSGTSRVTLPTNEEDRTGANHPQHQAAGLSHNPPVDTASQVAGSSFSHVRWFHYYPSF
jgi:hypothetical protein